MPSVPSGARRRGWGRWYISSSKAAGGASGATSAGSATSASAMAAMRSKRVHGGVAGAAARRAPTSARPHPQRLEGTDVKADAERGRHGGFEPGVAARGWAQAREHRAAGTPAGNHEDR